MEDVEDVVAEHFDRVKWSTEEIDKQIDSPLGPSPVEETVENAFVEWWKSRIPNGRIDNTKQPVGNAPNYGKRWWVPEENGKEGQVKPDLVFEEEDGLVVAESEVELNYEAIGQSLIHAWIYERSKRPAKEVIPAIVCCIAPRTFLRLARAHGIRVYFNREGHLGNRQK